MSAFACSFCLLAPPGTALDTDTFKAYCDACLRRALEAGVAPREAALRRLRRVQPRTLPAVLGEAWQPRSPHHERLLRRLASLTPRFLEAFDGADPALQQAWEAVVDELATVGGGATPDRPSLPPAHAFALQNVADACWHLRRAFLELKRTRDLKGRKIATLQVMALVSDLWALLPAAAPLAA